MTEASKRFFPVALAALALSFLAAGCGCSRPSDGGAPEKAGAPEDSVKARMADPAYVAKLDRHVAARDKVMKRLVAARDRLKAATDAGADAAALAAIRAEIEKGNKELRDIQKRAMADVRERMLRDTAGNAPKPKPATPATQAVEPATANVE